MTTNQIHSTMIITILVLPCPEQPPPISEGGWLWYDKEFSKYKCPNGKMFKNGNFPYWYSNCTVEKVWDPADVEECIRKYIDYLH